ncbi:MAG: trypsin-like peptidase domain-containing protein, partial [Bacteroidales bacterium]|nr:trypsin-like peptidase domain-containing protein [Bacteroidales bacterium]
KSGVLFILGVVVNAIVAFAIVKYYNAGGNICDIQEIVSNDNKVVAIDKSFPDFTYAAESSVDAVVYVQVIKRSSGQRGRSLLEFLLGGESFRPRESVNSGSGVIISKDGYIITNNHVVSGATAIEVTLTNNKKFSANLVGADAATDIALLKIDGVDLPTLPMGNSDELRLGEWVLAIGSPFNLRSTVTAGIVSAKGRSLPDKSASFKIESFIQTDAAVNPGNSGGALVNTKGELVGINTAIASNTGSYTGYSFAVPISIAQKVVEDIKQFGTVNRAMLGITMTELVQELAAMAKMESGAEGVFIAEVMEKSAAYDAGLKAGDVIVSISGSKVKNPSEVQAVISKYSPGDTIEISIVRDGEPLKIIVVLKGMDF